MPLSSPLYSIPYLALFGVLYFLYSCEKGKIKNGIPAQYAGRVAFGIMLVFTALRGHIYSDFISYYAFYEKLPSIFKLDNLFHGFLEPGFVLYSSILKTIIPNYFGWVFINTLIDLIVFFTVFKRYTHSIILPFIFFLAYQGLSIEFNLYRNVKALDLFLLSLPYLQQRKALPYILLNLLGATFHLSAVIYLVLYFFAHKTIPRSLVWSLILLGNIMFIGNIHITSTLIEKVGMLSNNGLMEKLSRYQNMDTEYGFSFGFFERTITIIICTLLYPKLVEQNPFNRIFFNLFLLYYLTFMMFSDVSVLTERIPLLLIFSIWILFSNVSVLKFRIRPIVMSLLLMISFFKIYVANRNIMSYYDNLLWGVKSYQERKASTEQYFRKEDL